MNKADKIIAYIMQQMSLIGENFGWQIGRIGANYENGYMKSNQDCKTHFRKEKVKQDIEQILSEEHIPEVAKKIETNADRIRSMTDEELIAFIKHPCKTIKEMTYPNRNCVFRCDECIEEWLKEKVE